MTKWICGGKKLPVGFFVHICLSQNCLVLSSLSVQFLQGVLFSGGVSAIFQLLLEVL
jgi:hypothetical protein